MPAIRRGRLAVNDGAEPDRIPVTFTVAGVKPTPGAGRLLALATVTIDLAGIELALHGLQVIRMPTGRLRCQAPQFRSPTGAWAPAVTMPEELETAIGLEVLKVGGFWNESR